MIYYVRVQVYAVPINFGPLQKGAKAFAIACHSRQQLSQLIGFRFISSIFPFPLLYTILHTYFSNFSPYHGERVCVVIYCAKFSENRKNPSPWHAH